MFTAISNFFSTPRSRKGAILAALRDPSAPKQCFGQFHRTDVGGEDFYCAMGLIAKKVYNLPVDSGTLATDQIGKKTKFDIFYVKKLDISTHLTSLDDAVVYWNDVESLTFAQIADKLEQVL